MQKNIDAETLRNAAMGVLPPAPEGYEAPPQVSRLLAGARREREKRENESAAASAAATSSLLSMHSLGTAGTGQSSHSFGPHGPAPVGDIGAALGGLAGLARAEEGPSHSPAAHPGSRPGLSHHSHSGAASAAAANAHELDEDSVWTTTLTSGLAPKRGENKDWTSLIRLGLGHGANGGGGYVDNRSGSTSASSASSASSSHNSPRPPATEPPAPVATSRPMPVFGGDMTLSLALPNDQPPGGLFSFPFFSLALGYSTLLPAPGAPTSGNGSSNCTTNTNTPRVTAISDVGGLVRLPPLHLWAHKGGAGEAGCSQVAGTFPNRPVLNPFTAPPARYLAQLALSISPSIDVSLYQLAYYLIPSPLPWRFLLTAAESFAEARPVLAAAMRYAPAPAPVHVLSQPLHTPLLSLPTPLFHLRSNLAPPRSLPRQTPVRDGAVAAADRGAGQEGQEGAGRGEEAQGRGQERSQGGLGRRLCGNRGGDGRR